MKINEVDITTIITTICQVS